MWRSIIFWHQLLIRVMTPDCLLAFATVPLEQTSTQNLNSKLNFFFKLNVFIYTSRLAVFFFSTEAKNRSCANFTDTERIAMRGVSLDVLPCNEKHFANFLYCMTWSSSLSLVCFCRWCLVSLKCGICMSFLPTIFKLIPLKWSRAKNPVIIYTEISSVSSECYYSHLKNTNVI